MNPQISDQAPVVSSKPLSTKIKILDVEPTTQRHDGRRVHHAARLAPPTISIDGYVEDVNGERYSRDIGRHFTLGGYHYYLFGDTFCTHRREYVGFVNNSAALVPDLENNPRHSEYADINADTGLVEPFLRFTAEEETLSNTLLQGEMPVRVTLWGFGGVVEVSPGVGLHWYQKGIIRNNRQFEYCGVGLATIRTDAATGRISTHRHPGLVFGPDEPKIGSLSSLLHGDTLYLWGEHANNAVLARVPLSSPEQRDQYTFWTGSDWDPHWRRAAIVFENMPQGQVFASALFGPDWPWAFVGTGSWADSTIWVGRARALEGPWELLPAGHAAALDHPTAFRYCIYPLPTTVRADRGLLGVVWSESWPGGVVMARLTFPTFAYQLREIGVGEYWGEGYEEDDEGGEGEGSGEGGVVGVEQLRLN